MVDQTQLDHLGDEFGKASKNLAIVTAHKGFWLMHLPDE